MRLEHKEREASVQLYTPLHHRSLPQRSLHSLVGWASIFAFIPTITALLSNSINEVSSIANKSILLAVAPTLSSVTAFNARFHDKNVTFTYAIFAESSAGSHPQAAWANLNDKKRPKQRWLGWKIRNSAMFLMLLVRCALVWYEVPQIARYGNIAFVCSVKVSVGIWAHPSQCRMSPVWNLHSCCILSIRKS